MADAEKAIEPPEGVLTDLGIPENAFNDVVMSGSIRTPGGAIIPAEELQVTNATATAITVGGIPAGTTFDNVTLPEFVDMLLYPELFPTLVAPSNVFSLSQAGLREIGETVTLNFLATFSRGSITPAYTTSGYRSGLPTEYLYTGSGIVSSHLSASLTDTQTVSGYTVVAGAQNWTNSVAYSEGEQPLSSKGNDYDTPLAAGNTSAKTVTITGVYPVFATTSSISIMTKQALASMTSSYFQVNMVAESGGNKQTADFPTAWAAIMGIQFYNTVSSTWEWIGGTKAASLLTFDTEVVSNIVQGLSVNYNRFSNNGATIGARQLRFYTT